MDFCRYKSFHVHSCIFLFRLLWMDKLLQYPFIGLQPPEHAVCGMPYPYDMTLCYLFSCLYFMCAHSTYNTYDTFIIAYRNIAYLHVHSMSSWHDQLRKYYLDGNDWSYWIHWSLCHKSQFTIIQCRRYIRRYCH